MFRRGLYKFFNGGYHRHYLLCMDLSLFFVFSGTNKDDGNEPKKHTI